MNPADLLEKAEKNLKEMPGAWLMHPKQKAELKENCQTLPFECLGEPTLFGISVGIDHRLDEDTVLEIPQETWNRLLEMSGQSTEGAFEIARYWYQNDG